MNEKIKSSAIKALILFFMIFVAFSAMFRYFGGGIFRQAEELDEYEIRFTVKDISSNSVRYFLEGDTVIAEGGIVLGTLQGTDKVKPVQVYVTNSDGEVDLIGYPPNSRVDVYGSILARGKLDGGFYLSGTKHIASGDKLYVSTEHLDVIITVTEIVKK